MKIVSQDKELNAEPVPEAIPVATLEDSPDPVRVAMDDDEDSEANMPLLSKGTKSRGRKKREIFEEPLASSPRAKVATPKPEKTPVGRKRVRKTKKEEDVIDDPLASVAIDEKVLKELEAEPPQREVLAPKKRLLGSPKKEEVETLASKRSRTKSGKSESSSANEKVEKNVRSRGGKNESTKGDFLFVPVPSKSASKMSEVVSFQHFGSL